MPGVTTVSGSMPPGATACVTCAMVRAAAIAIKGEKFRAAIR